MPLYDYRCADCGSKFERLFLSLNRVPDEVVCDICGSASTKRLVSAPVVSSGAPGSGETESTVAKPRVFGRKELDAATKAKSRS